MRVIRKKIITLLIVYAVVISAFSQIPVKTAKAANNVKVYYRTHIQTYGWEGKEDTLSTWKTDGDMSGTAGMAKRLEGIEIKISGNSDLRIQYTTHCQSYGWLPWSVEGEMNGTEGEAKRLEAIKIRLTGADADKYDVYYRVHAQTYGWLAWAKNGQAAGTAGLAKRLEGIQIVVIPEGQTISNEYKGITSTNDKAYISSTGVSDVNVSGANLSNISYKTHVQTYGWQGWKYNGDISGTSGMAKRLEGLNIKLTNMQYDGGITYRTHVQSYGWQDWVSNGAMAGTSGEAKRLEAIQIYLTGDMAKYYDLYYRVHAQTFGWLGWVKNGEPSGTAGYGKRLEAIQVVLVKKGTGNPGNVGGIVSNTTKGFEYTSATQVPENPYIEPAGGDNSNSSETESDDSNTCNEDDSYGNVTDAQELLKTLPDEVKLYFVSDFKEEITLPKEYPTSYQLDLSAFENMPKFKIGGGWSYERGLVEVTETGMISSHDIEHAFCYDVWVDVTYEGATKRINIVACDYLAIYTDERLDEISKQFQSGYDNDYDRYVAITRYVAQNYDYNASYGSTSAMIIKGGGCCIGNSSLIIDICKKCGIDARERNGNRDPGGLSGHKNVIAKIDGKYYVAEAGYTGTAPRGYYVNEEKDGFLIRSMDGEKRLIQYSGFAEHAIIPDAVEILGYEIPTSHVYGYWGGVFCYSDVKEVTISSSIKEIAPNTFTAADKLQNIYVNEENEFFTDVDGVLYTKDKETLIAMPEQYEKYCVEKGTKVISRYAFRNCYDFENVLVLPEGVKTLEDYSFLDYHGKVEIPSSVTYISDSAFLGDEYTDNYFVPSTNYITIIGDKGSYAEEYANKLGIPFEVR